MEHGDALRVVPDDDAIARAIASVPGVAEADIVRPAGGGRSRLTLRLHPGEDDQRVAWAVAATLRERFDIDLDPDAIRPRMTPHAAPDHDPVSVVRTDDADDPSASDGVAEGDRTTDGADVADAHGAANAHDTHGAHDADGAVDPDDTSAGAAGRATDPADGGSTPARVPWPPRDRPWTAREPIDPAGGRPESGGPASSGPVRSAAAGQRLDEATAQGRPIQLTTTRERLSRAVEDALAGLGAPAHAGADAGADDAAADGTVGPDGSGAPTPEAPEPAASEPAASTATAPTASEVAASEPASEPATRTADAADTMLRPPRAVIEHLEVRRGHDAVEVTVSLRHEAHTASGTARSVPTSKGRMRATAEATVAAVHALVQASLVVGVDRIVLTDGGEDVTVSVVLTMVTAGDEQRLLGGAIVRDDTDAEGAVVRATLDALNRRVVPLLARR